MSRKVFDEDLRDDLWGFSVNPVPALTMMQVEAFAGGGLEACDGLGGDRARLRRFQKVNVDLLGG